MRQSIRSFIGLLGLLITLGACSSKISPDDSQSDDNHLGELSSKSLRRILRNSFDTLTAANYIADTNSREELMEELESFYRFNSFNLRWCTAEGTSEETLDLLNLLSFSNEHGLNPELYRVDHLVDLTDSVYTYNFNSNPYDIVRLDLSLTAAYVSYAWHLYNGVVNPEQIVAGWHKADQNTQIAQYLAGKSLKQSLEMVEPSNYKYNALRRKLETYISIANEGGWPALPDTMELKLGDYDEAVYDLRDRLSYSGDFKSGLSRSGFSGAYDDKLADAVKSFQKRHGLNATGIANQETIEALNVPVEYRIAQIKINLERLRWMPRKINDRYLLVNVPEFKLKVYKKGNVQSEMKVIVGKQDNPTPMINSVIEYIIMSPTWTVPNQIFNKSVLPLVKNDPEYLERSGYKLYASLNGTSEEQIDEKTLNWSEMNVIKNTYKVVHTPAPTDENRGGIKFVIPAAESFYLCDAPTPLLFDFSYRIFNYTCISVEEPERLAKYIINDRDWGIQDIKQGMNLEDPERVDLDNKMPIYITYLTSLIDDDGNILFGKDIYGYDSRQAELMGIVMSVEKNDDSYFVE